MKAFDTYLRHLRDQSATDTPSDSKASTNSNRQPTNLNVPWALHFDRDGTEDFGIICGADGNDIAASHLPSTRIGERTFHTGTFWLPESDDEETPVLVRQLQLMTAAPKLYQALAYLLEQTVDQDLKYGIALTEGEEDARAQALIAIAEAEGRAA